jgi:DNA-binding XRE family transcriptional regulator
VFERVEWPDGFGPGQEDYGRSWVDVWLGAKVSVALSTAVAELAPGGAPPPALPARALEVEGKAVRSARMRRGLEQRRLAKDLGISTPYLSSIENGKREPSERLKARLRAWLSDSPIPE